MKTPNRTARRSKAPAMEQVTLLREHTHLGKKHPPGTEIQVHPETARWLREVGVVSLTTTVIKD